MPHPLPQAQLYRLKALQRDLIDRCGGIERAALLCGYSRSHVGRWHERSAPDLMCLAALLVLEADAGEPLLSQVLMQSGDRRGKPTPGPLEAFATLSAETADLAREMAEALRDGRLTGAERARLDEQCAELGAALSAMRAGLASGASDFAMGGLKS